MQDRFDFSIFIGEINYQRGEPFAQSHTAHKRPRHTAIYTQDGLIPKSTFYTGIPNTPQRPGELQDGQILRPYHWRVWLFGSRSEPGRFSRIHNWRDTGSHHPGMGSDPLGCL